MVMTASEQLEAALVRHQVYLLAYSNSVRTRINNLLRDTEERLAGRIMTTMGDGGLPNVNSDSRWTKLNALQESLAILRGKAWDEATDFLVEDLQGLAKQETIFMQSALIATVPVTVAYALPTAAQLRTIVMSRPFEGQLLKDWAESIKQDDLRRIKKAIQVGMASGESTDRIVRNIIGTGGVKGVDGATEVSRRQVQSVVRTAIQHVANRSRDAFFEENADIVDEEYFVATLDSRTTPICAANDGKRFARGKGPMPPLHFGCRSLRIAGLNASFLGDRPANPTTQKLLLQEYAESANIGRVTSRDKLPSGHKTKFDKWAQKRKRELIGPVPSKTTYQEFLKNQSKGFQDEVLGSTKGKLFRDGNMKLDRFVSRDGHEYTLAELAKRDRQAFLDAGLNPDVYND